MNFVEVKKKENLGIKNMGSNVLASRNILKFALTEQNKLTAGTVGRACGGVGVSRTNEAGTIDGRSLRS